MHGLVVPAASSPTRLSPVHSVICIRLKQKYALPVETRFELHSVSGFRLQNGALQIERIAGFCHLRNSLKTYWLDQIESIRDPSGELIHDLTKWLDQRQPDMTNEAMAASSITVGKAMPDHAAESRRQLGTVSKSIDKAIEAAALNGYTDIADRLRGIKSLLRNTGPAAAAL